MAFRVIRFFAYLASLYAIYVVVASAMSGQDLIATMQCLPAKMWAANRILAGIVAVSTVAIAIQCAFWSPKGLLR